MKFEAIKEAMSFIKDNWIDKSNPYWEGTPYEFVGATIFGGVTKADVKRIIKAILAGEHVDIDGLTGEINNNELIKIRVTR